MKFASAMLLAATASATNVFSVQDAIKQSLFGSLLSHESRIASSGAMVEEKVFDNHVERTISFPSDPTGEYRRTKLIENMTEGIKEQKQMMQKSNGNTPIYTCTDREPDGTDLSTLAFLPTFAGEVNAAYPTATYAGNCFQNIDFTFAKTSDTTFDVTVNLANPKSSFCHDNIFFANTEIFHMESFFRKGSHTLHFNMPTVDAQADVNYNGINLFGFCDGIEKTVESFVNSLKAFVGGTSDHPNVPVFGSHVPPYQEKANIEFLTQSMGYTMQPRTVQTIDIDPSLIQSGDYFAVMRLDGLDQIIMYGTGSHSGHSVEALRFDGELYIVESQDAWYWPTHGLQRTKWADWIKQAAEADFHVTWCPLSAEARSRFNEKAPQDFFFSTEGLPYGYHNFLYGWIDTADNNWPPLLPFNFAPIMFAMIEKFDAKLVYTFFTEALNFRLGVRDKNIADIAAIAASKNMSVEDVMAMVEEDGW